MRISVDPAHHPIQQLVKVYETLINGGELHPHHILDYIADFLALHAQGRVHVAHESHQTRVFDLETIVVRGEVCPNLFEPFSVIFEPRDDIISIQVISLELLNNDQDEQVQHNERAEHHIWKEEKRGP